MKKINNLDSITKDTFKEAVYEAYKGGITSIAPLGRSGETIIIYDQVNPVGISGRCSQVSIRNYSGDAELLITDYDGGFLFYGRYRIELGIDFVVDQYWDIFMKVKDSINLSIPRKIDGFSKLKIPKGALYTEGFDMMKEYYRIKLKSNGNR